jgi:hypothetical protein
MSDVDVCVNTIFPIIIDLPRKTFVVYAISDVLGAMKKRVKLWNNQLAPRASIGGKPELSPLGLHS